MKLLRPFDDNQLRFVEGKDGQPGVVLTTPPKMGEIRQGTNGPVKLADATMEMCFGQLVRVTIWEPVRRHAKESRQ